jgi:hypothetical protein
MDCLSPGMGVHWPQGLPRRSFADWKPDLGTTLHKSLFASFSSEKEESRFLSERKETPRR